MEREKALVVITGTDSGIGKACTELFLANGYTVIGTHLGPPPDDDAIHVRCDLRNEDDITAVGRRVEEVVVGGSPLVCLFDNAGVAYGGAIENLPLSLFRENFEINFFGLASLTQKLLPFLIESKGRIILHGSAAGKTAVPFLAPYAATKHALEAYADCLRRELLPYGIPVTILETGGVATPIWDGFAHQDTSFMDRKFDASMKLFTERFLRGPKGLTAREAAEKIFDVFNRKNPPPRAIIARSVFRERLIRLIPARTLDRIFASMFGMDYGVNSLEENSPR
jgi:NAD(P)-dependent dehydrogenase (short-subunit alcohol dehydrogenase family)